MSTQIDTESRSGLRLRKRIVSQKTCERGLQNVEYIALDKVKNYTDLVNSIHIGVKPSSDWATIGVINKCHSQDDFCVVRITDLKGCHLHVYVTDKAYKRYQEEIGMGSVMAVKRPFLLKPSDVSIPNALHVSQIQQMWIIGLSQDLARCTSHSRKGKRCEEWTDRRSGEFCDIHLSQVCRFAKNGRMELASGGFDITWATSIKQTDGSMSYCSDNPTPEQPTKGTRKIAYYIKGKGLVAIDSTLVQKKTTTQKESTPEEKAMEFFKGKRDPGAEMIRKLKGIEYEEQKNVFSNDALNKMGMGNNALTKEEEEDKKRLFDSLNQKVIDNMKKKPRYVYL
ncbi:hypothetical protein BDB01DRAFT_850953 [Pilobolus umbonatus]|nr:hypothetical protein BDB01DRAFT_850953 [Pilobolus umbonatus]